VKVVSGVLEDQGAVLVGEFAAEFGGNAGPEGSWRDDGVFRNYGAGGNDGTGPNAAIVQDPGANTDKALIFNHASVNGSVVANGYPVAHHYRVEVALAMEHGAVLDVGIGSDADGVYIAAKDGVHPDGGVGAESHIANKLGRNIDVAGVVDMGRVALVSANHE